jgi:hypothetical protein
LKRTMYHAKSKSPLTPKFWTCRKWLCSTSGTADCINYMQSYAVISSHFSTYHIKYISIISFSWLPASKL